MDGRAGQEEGEAGDAEELDPAHGRRARGLAAAHRPPVLAVPRRRPGRLPADARDLHGARRSARPRRRRRAGCTSSSSARRRRSAARGSAPSPSDEVDFDKYESRSAPTPDERLASFDLVGRAAEALQRLKPQELRALWLKAQGHSYNEISALTGWSYTKVNRCLTEGRRSFLARYADDRVRRGVRALAARHLGDGRRRGVAASSSSALRPHLRNCPGCRATLKTLQGSAEPLAAVLPVPLAGTVAARRQTTSRNLVTRVYETVVGGFHERAIYSFTKAQTAVEAASAGKLAAVAASAAAVAGGGYADRRAQRAGRARPRQAGEGGPAQPAAASPHRVVPVVSTPPPPVRRITPIRPARAKRRRAAVGEFGPPARTAKARRRRNSLPPSDPRRSSPAQPRRCPTPAARPPAARRRGRAAPEFGAAGPAPEFGG